MLWEVSKYHTGGFYIVDFMSFMLLFKIFIIMNEHFYM